jgi:hypothetical protein
MASFTAGSLHGTFVLGISYLSGDFSSALSAGWDNISQRIFVLGSLSLTRVSFFGLFPFKDLILGHFPFNSFVFSAFSFRIFLLNLFPLNSLLPNFTLCQNISFRLFFPTVLSSAFLAY